MTDDKVRVTNTAQVRIEEQLAEQARRAALTGRALFVRGSDQGRGRRAPASTSPASRSRAAQLAAIYALGQGGALTLLTGVAGAGKTTLLQPLVAAWQAGHAVQTRAGGRWSAWRRRGGRPTRCKDAGIERTFAMLPMLEAIESGEFQPTRNTVLVIDEVSQVGPRPMLALLELQARTGMTIKALGDREQAQAIEAGDTIELLRRALPKAAARAAHHRAPGDQAGTGRSPGCSADGAQLKRRPRRLR